jgi:two-component system, OmpR family, phosphate regulon response regulator PhoB
MGGPVSTILLVEDDPDIRELVAYKLSRGGFEVIEAADGLAALQAARTRPPDAVVLDMGLPRLSGIEVCRELRAAPATAAVPIIMLTGAVRLQELEQAYAAGASDYLVKPFSPRELQRRVEAALVGVVG